MKKRVTDLTEREYITTLDTLYTAIGSIRDRGSAKRLLRELLTESERIMLGRRIIIARKLLSGATYEDIQSSLGVGIPTILKVRKWLSSEMNGYENAIHGIQREMAKRERKTETKRLWRTLKRKYPLHFLLFPS